MKKIFLVLLLVFFTGALRADHELTPEVGEVHPDETRVTQSVENAKNIDAALERTWNTKKITPVKAASWDEWIRRASLDLMGRNPTGLELSWIESLPEDRRQNAVCDRWVDSRDWAKYEAERWPQSFLPRARLRNYSDRTHSVLEKIFNNQNLDLRDVLKQALLKRLPEGYNPAESEVWLGLTDNIFTENIGSRANMGQPGPSQNNWEPMIQKLGNHFLGAATQCAQCHDNPLREGPFSKQSHYSGIKAALSNLDEYGEREPGLPDRPEQTFKSSLSANKADQFAGPNYFGQALTPNGKKAPSFLPSLVEALVSDKRFAVNQVNRTWEHMFGLPLNAPGRASDFDESEVNDPKLFSLLNDQLVRNKFNPREMARTLCKTRAYRLTSEPADAADKGTPLFFQRMTQKPLKLEQFDRVLGAATNDRVSNQREDLSKKLFEAGYSPDQEAGRLEHGNNLGAALAIWSSEPAQRLIDASAATLSKSPTTGMELSPPEQIEAAFVTFYARKPSEDERKTFLEFYKGSETKAATEDLIAAILLSEKFHKY